MERFLAKAKRKDNGEWVEGYYVPFPKINKHTIYYDATGNGMMLVTDIDPETLCQYTGQTDDYEEKIWENDKIYIVSVDIDCTCCDPTEDIVIVKRTSAGFYPFDVGNSCTLIEMRVVGNLFD